MGDYSMFAMGAVLAARRFDACATIPIATRATTIPASTSSQKWFAVARTQNQTQAGQSAQSAFDHHRRLAAKRQTPTTSASAACRLGIAAYGFAIAPSRPWEWLTPSTKPKLGN